MIEEHKKVAEFKRISNIAIAGNVEGFKHEIVWDKVIQLERKKRLFSRKSLESAYINECREKCMNLNQEVGVSKMYGKGKEAWLRKKKKTRYMRRRKRRVVLIIKIMVIRFNIKYILI